MIITLDSVIPAPIAGTYKESPDCVWSSQLDIDSSKISMVRADSGKGKSTLLNIIYGIRDDYAGSVRIDGADIRGLSLTDWSLMRSRRMSILFQDLKLFPTLSAIDNLRIKNSLTDHLSENEMRGMMDKLGIGDRAEQKCGTLSLGQQQRLAIIRSLCQPFELLMLDEPFSHIDESNQRIATELIVESCKKNGAGLIMTSLGESYFFNYDHIYTV